ncbi:MAG: FliO/MopB family protein [Agromyces sp.]
METLFLVLRVAVSLGVVLAVIWFAHRRITATRARSRKAELVTVVARQSLAPKASMVVVDADGRRLMLGVTEHGVSVLSDRPAPEPVAAPAFDEALTAASVANQTTPIMPATHGLRRGPILSAETWKRSLAGVKEGLGI